MQDESHPDAVPHVVEFQPRSDTVAALSPFTTSGAAEAGVACSTRSPTIKTTILLIAHPSLDVGSTPRALNVPEAFRTAWPPQSCLR